MLLPWIWQTRTGTLCLASRYRTCKETKQCVRVVLPWWMFLFFRSFVCFQADQSTACEMFWPWIRIEDAQRSRMNINKKNHFDPFELEGHQWGQRRPGVPLPAPQRNKDLFPDESGEGLPTAPCRPPARLESQTSLS